MTDMRWRLALLCWTSLFAFQVIAEPLYKKTDEFFYTLGGGRAIPRSATGYVTYRIGARFTYTPGYSCGQFNLEQNLEQALNRIRDQITGLPDQLGMAATSAIASLPLYLVKNYAPDIYGLLVWNLDQSIELFRFQYKSCETLEAEIHAHDEGYNPYAQAVRASVLNQWEIGARVGESLDQTQRQIQDNPGARGVNFLGNGRGTAEHPIPLKHDLMVLAYNNRIGRYDDPLNETAPVGQSQNPLVQIWPTPKAAADWVIAATGEFWITVEQGAQKDSAPGIGLRPEIDELTDRYAQAIVNAVLQRDHALLDELERNTPPRLRLADALIESLRQLPLEEQSLSMERLASDTAVSLVKHKVDLAQTLLRASVQDPDIATSQLAGIAGQIAQQTRTWLREEMDEISQTLQIERMGIGATPVLIINRSHQKRFEHAPLQPTPGSNPRPMVDEGVPE